MATTDAGRIVLRGRAKAYRPMPDHARRAALSRGLDAYDRGDWFLAHEILEPAWLGTADPGERDLLQGLIKLSASFVHAVRRNVDGQRKNLVGARALLGGDDVPRSVASLEPRLRPDLPALLDRIDERLVRLAAADRPILEPLPIVRGDTAP